MKTILHIITGLNDGGAEAVLHRLCVHDTRSRHRVVSLMDAGKYGPLLKAAGVPLLCLDMPRGRVTGSGLWRLWRHISEQKPDVVQTWMYHANLLGGLTAWLAGRRNIVWGVHHTDVEAGGVSRRTAMIAKLGGRLSRFLGARTIFCAARSAQNHVAFGYDPNRIFIVPNGYDLSVFFPNVDEGEKFKADLGLDRSQRLIGFVARHDVLKDHGNLFGALGVLKSQRRSPMCLLVGTGMEEANTALSSQIEFHGLTGQVLLLGRRADIPVVMNALDIHVMSSVSEAFPNVLAEAMACGTPCVTTDVGDAAAIVGEVGWVAPPRDPQALAAAIGSALDAREASDWPVRRKEARRRVETLYSIERMVAAYHDVWFSDSERRSDERMQGESR